MSAATTFANKQQNTEEWLQERRKFMGSSDAPAALGMSRWCSPLEVAREKKTARTSEHHPQPETPEMRRGHVLEPVVACLYEKVTGRTVSTCPSAISNEHPFMAASPDRAINEGPDDALLECKTHVIWTRDQYGEAGTDAVTDYEFIQVQHQMAVTGAKRVDVAILFGEGQALQILSEMLDSGNVALSFAMRMAEQMEFCIFPVHRDEDFIATLIEAEREFWTRYVEGDEIPEDYAKIAPRSGIRKATEDEEESAQKLKTAWILSKRAEPLFEDAKATMQDAIADAEGIDTREGVITWKKNKDTVKAVTNWEAIARYFGTEYCSPDGFDEIVKEHTEEVVKPGPRVFRVPASWKKEL